MMNLSVTNASHHHSQRAAQGRIERRGPRCPISGNLLSSGPQSRRKLNFAGAISYRLLPRVKCLARGL